MAEEEAESCYAAIRDQSTDNGVRLLTYFLARHRRRRDEALADLDPQHLEHLRALTMAEALDFSPAQTLAVLSRDPVGVTGPELLAAAIASDIEFIRLYQALLQHPEAGPARPALEALIRVEEHDMVMLRKMQAMHYF